MEGREVNAVVVAEVQGTMLSEVLEGAGVVNSFEDAVNDLPSPRCGWFFSYFGTTHS